MPGVKELKADQKISGRYTKVFSRKGTLLYTFNVDFLSLESISLREASNHYVYFGEKKSSKLVSIKSDDTPYYETKIYEIYPNYLEGQDGYGNRFRAEVYGYNQVLITDDENRARSPFLYRLE